MLEEVFNNLLKQYTTDNALIKKLWTEIVKSYSKHNRHYHTLQHLENLFFHLKEVQPQINNWNAILFTLFYHDVVYNTLKHNNEEKSAALAIEKMKSLNVDDATINKCEAIILATKTHQFSDDNDINLFTDADLSILGSSWNDYETYLKNVRQEYSLYPDIVYNPGRKKVLQHFLNMQSIYKTTFFFDKLEHNARLNLSKELQVI